MTAPEAMNLPAEVAALLGDSPRRLGGYGAAMAIGGREMVAKIEPPATVEREVRILGGELEGMTVEVPERG